MGKLRCGASGRRSRGQSLRQLFSPNSSHVRNALSDDAIFIEVSHRSVVNVQYRQRFSYGKDTNTHSCGSMEKMPRMKSIKSERLWQDIDAKNLIIRDSPTLYTLTSRCVCQGPQATQLRPIFMMTVKYGVETILLLLETLSSLSSVSLFRYLRSIECWSSMLKSCLL